jgi:drug/metabolite transporter (DMT)-like permease
MVLSGVVLSLHFAAYILAVKETTVANATFLVNTGPVMLVILSPIVIKERTTRREMWGVILATLGVLLVADAGNGFRTFGWPDLSALAAAFLLALYSLIGRQLRTSGITTGCYTSYVYSIAASVSLLLAWGVGAPISGSYDLQNLIAILGLALVPTVVGHSLYNYALGSVKAVTANLFPLLEPIIASLLAVQLFNEIPTPIQVIGYTLILSSVFIVVTRLE